MVNTVELTEEGAVRPATSGGVVDPMIGRRLLHYRAIERIGQGGMSMVYRGVDERLNRDVAIKVLHPFLAEKSECRARLAREARAVARLEHENILRIFDFSGDPATLDAKPTKDASGERSGPVGVESDEGFIITELVPGDTLKHFAEDHHLYEVPEVGALVVWQLARALQHAHQQGVVHRDLKPENVMVREDGVLKLMDFGIAQVVDSKSLTVTGTLLGSPAHMAPECIEGQHADGRSDIFSLGTVLYWLMCGALPFEAVSPHALLKAIVDGRFAPPQQRQPRVSDALAKVVRRTLATAPDDRYQTAGALADALAEALAQGGVDASASKVVELLADPPTSFPRLSLAVRAATLKRASELLDEESPAKALSALGRVLAEHPGDEEAQALIERAHSLHDDDLDDDDDEDEDEALVSPPPVVAAPDDGVTAVTGELTASAITAPQPVSTGVYAQRAGLVAVAAAMIGLVVVLAQRVPNDAPGERAAPKEAAAEADRPATEGMSLVPERRAAQAPPSTPGTADGAATKRAPSTDKPPSRASTRKGAQPGEGAKPRSRGAPADKAKVAAKAAGRGAETSKSAQGAGKLTLPPAVLLRPPTEEGDKTEIAGPVVRRVLVKANAFGEVSIDGKERLPIDPRRIIELKLEVGPHRLLFSHPAARTVEEKLTVTAEGPPPRINVQFAPRPAHLIIDADVPEAFVSLRPLLDGAEEVLVGQAKATVQRAYPVSFPPDPAGRLVGKMRYQLTAKHGDLIVTRQIDLRAGATKRVKLELKR